MRPLIAVAVFSLLLSSSLRAEEGKTRVLTGEEIKTEIVGNTISGATSSGHPYTEYYRDDGRILAKDYAGSWRIEGDRMCVDYDNNDDYDGCWSLALDGRRMEWLKDGVVFGEGTVLEGNPLGL